MHSSLALLVLILLIAVITVTICRSLKVPTLLGYLLVGFIVSPDMLGILPDSEQVNYLGEIGIVFMMFTIGLEFSLPRLTAMRKQVFGIGMAQVAFSLILIMGITFAITHNLMCGFAVGATLAMSSTAIISKQLSERLELAKPHGQVAIGVLLFQDIAVIPLLILLPALSSNSDTLLIDLSLALLKTIGVMFLLLWVGKRLMRPWFNLVARQRSSELFMINVLLVTLGVAYLTQLFGLSLALGAFVAGMLISETEYRYQVEEDIRPFRDILLGFFFISVGLKISPAVVWQYPAEVLLFITLLIFGKATIVYFVSRFFGQNNKTALHASLILAHGGEFAFVLLALSHKLNIIEPQMEQQILAALLISMMLAPFFVQHADKIVRLISRKNWEEDAANLHQILVQSMNKDEHVLICGYGQSGQALARLLESQQVPFFAIELDPERVNEANKVGDSIIYGDASRKEVLIAAGLPRAKAVVITFADLRSSNLILSAICSEYKNIPVIVRTHNEKEVKKLRESGAYEVVVDTMEGALMLATQAMKAVGLSNLKIMQCMQNMREERYELFQGFFRDLSDEAAMENSQAAFRISSIPIPEGAYAVNQALGALNIDSFKTKIKAIRRRGICHTGFDETWQINSGDELIMLGAPEQLALTESFLLLGERDSM